VFGQLGAEPAGARLRLGLHVAAEVAGHPGQQPADAAGEQVELAGLVRILASLQQREQPVAHAQRGEHDRQRRRAEVRLGDASDVLFELLHGGGSDVGCFGPLGELGRLAR
jgi:hypothetical protein